MNTDFYIVEDDSKDYNLLFHQPTAMIAKIGKSATLHELNLEDLDHKLETKQRKQSAEKLELGKGRISLTYMSARTCNLGCKYCFAGEGEYGKKSEKRNYFTTDLYKETFEMALRMYPEGIKKIGFFGGEPLLNFQAIKEFVPWCNEQLRERKLDRIRYVITTNGILLTEDMIAFIKEYHITVSISMDGGKIINDAARIYKNSSQSVYEMVAKKCELLEEYGADYNIQATINRYHVKDYKEGAAIAWIKSLEKFEFKNISIVPVETDLDELKIHDGDERRNLERFTRELTNYYLDKLEAGEIKKIASMLVTPMIQLARNEYVRSCSSGHSFFYDTDGSAYSCHMFCNCDDFKLGDMKNGLDADKVKQIANMKREEGEACRKCIAKNICFTWCKGIQFLSNHDVNQVCESRCIFQKANIEECIKRLVELSSNPERSQVFWKNYQHFSSMLRSAGYEYKVMV